MFVLVMEHAVRASWATARARVKTVTWVRIVPPANFHFVLRGVTDMVIVIAQSLALYQSVFVSMAGETLSMVTSHAKVARKVLMGLIALNALLAGTAVGLQLIRVSCFVGNAPVMQIFVMMELTAQGTVATRPAQGAVEGCSMTAAVPAAREAHMS